MQVDVQRLGKSIGPVRLVRGLVVLLVERGDLHIVHLEDGSVEVGRSRPALREPRADPEAPGFRRNVRVVRHDGNSVEIELDARSYRPRLVSRVPVETVGVEIAVVLALRELHVARRVLVALLADPRVAERIVIADVLVCRTGTTRHLDIDLVIYDVILSRPLESGVARIELFVLECPHRTADARCRRDLRPDFIAARSEVVPRHGARTDALAVLSLLAVLRDAENVAFVEVAVRHALEDAVLDEEIRGIDAAIVILRAPLVDLSAPVLVGRVPLRRIDSSGAEVVVERIRLRIRGSRGQAAQRKDDACAANIHRFHFHDFLS